MTVVDPSHAREVEPNLPSTRQATIGARSAIVASYAVVGTVFCLTHLLGLGHSFWHDEIYTVTNIIRPGPGRIFAGPELNHQSYSILAWAGQYVFGHSEVAYRLWSVLPFLAGVAGVTIWAHRRLGALTGILFLFLATISPLLLDITREARGYGLGFLAMAVLTTAALEADRGAGTRAVVAFCLAGVIGTWTLPQFVIAFVAMGLVLLSKRPLRGQTGIGLVLSLVAIAAWYAPHLRELHAVSTDSGRAQIHTAWLVTAPIDQILVPALLWIDAIVLVPGVVWLPVVLAAVMLMASGPLARDRRALLLLSAGTLASIAVLWITQTYVVPRYLSFLLVPLFLLLASGMSDVLGHLRDRPMLTRSLVSILALGFLSLRFLSIAPDVVRLPREAHRDAAAIIDRSVPADVPVFAYLHNPTDLAYYLDRPYEPLTARDVARRVCSANGRLVYVTQPFVIKDIEVPCLARKGVQHYRIRQYTRGEMNVWLVPPLH
jgi:hypothetical protein